MCITLLFLASEGMLSMTDFLKLALPEINQEICHYVLCKQILSNQLSICTLQYFHPSIE